MESEMNALNHYSSRTLHHCFRTSALHIIHHIEFFFLSMRTYYGSDQSHCLVFHR